MKHLLHAAALILALVAPSLAFARAQ